MKFYKSPQEVLSNYEDEHFLVLVFKYMDVTISPDENKELQRRLNEDRKCREVFVALLIQFQQIKETEKGSGSNQIISNDVEENRVSDFNRALLLLAQDEMFSPTIEISEEKPQRELIQKVVYPPREKHKMSTFSKLSFIAAAAMILFIVYLRFAPQKPKSVALLNRMVESKWGRGESDFQEGQALYPGEMMTLLSGQVELLFDCGATVIVEGPAEFSVEKTHQIFLDSGRLVAHIDNGSSGEVFVVRSPYSCVVDYGTEFGVKVNVSGFETYVFEGKVDVREGTDPMKFEHSVLLRAGEGAVDWANQTVHKAVVAKSQFIGRDGFELRRAAANGSRIARWKLYADQMDNDSSLVAHYTFDPDAAHPGLLVNRAGGATESTFGRLDEEGYNTPMWTQGRWAGKKAMQFDRKAKNRIRIPADPKLCIAGDVTLGVWFKLNPIDNQDRGGHILSCRTENGVNYQLGYFKEYKHATSDSSYRIQFLRREMESKESFLSSDEVVLDTQQWHFVAITHDGQDVRYYVDGALLCEAPFVYSGEAIDSCLYIGDAPDNKFDYSTGFFHGLLDEVLLFNRALSDIEVEAIYWAGKPDLHEK